MDVRLEAQLAAESIAPESHGVRGFAYVEQPHMQSVVASVDPVQCIAHDSMWHQYAKAVAADGALDGTAPGALFVRDFDEFCDVGQMLRPELQVLRQLGAELQEFGR
ncbi:hypothetical protein SDC9_78815 [bioreactor metagenome]|uniref:Uncharacterized protein n=1 Tax=bioreactor metagenome TaxID=1076179 RepID=A0A644Z0I7_9ZZZZ